MPDAPLIMVVDDDTAFIGLMDEVLTEEGYNTIICRNGQEAFGRVKATMPNLVILDLRIPTMDAGLMVLEMLRLDPVTSKLPILLCSADQRFLREKEQHLRDRHCDILEKPFELDELLAKIEQNLIKVQSSDS
jgi:CheY-like chemotaxis protein